MIGEKERMTQQMIYREKMIEECTYMPDHAVAMPHAKTSTLDRTFLHSAIRIWNTLPDTVVGKIKSDSVQSFKQRVNKHMLFDG